MHYGKLIYNIKYDLGTHLSKDKLKSGETLKTLRTKYPDVKLINTDLTIFNLSFLSRTVPDYLLYEGEIDFLGIKWIKTIILNGIGTLTFRLVSENINGKTPSLLCQNLLKFHFGFIDDKNKDYLLYLQKSEQKIGRLKNMLSPEKLGVIDFSIETMEIRNLLSLNIDEVDIYYFHDYRPIFLLSDEAYAEHYCLNQLLNLEVIDEQMNTICLDDPKNCTNDKQIYGRTWSFVGKLSSWEDMIFGMFDHAHTKWYQAQSSIFEMRDLEKLIEQKLHSKKINSSQIEGLLHHLSERQSIMYSEMFSAMNADFITKSSKHKEYLSWFMEQLGVQEQITLLGDYIDRITAIVSSTNERLNLIETRNLAKNTRVLEILFLLNTIAGIAGFAPILFQNDLSNTVEFDTPRMLAFLIVIGSFALYLALIVTSKVSGHMKEKNTSFSRDLL